MIPEMKPVTSSNIHSIGYSPEARQLHIKFKSGGHYSYDSVPKEEFEAMQAAPSVGGHFAHNFAGKYQHTKIAPDAG